MEPAITVLAGSDFDVINNITTDWRADESMIYYHKEVNYKITAWEKWGELPLRKMNSIKRQ